MTRRAGIVGTGLIGASAGLRLRELGWFVAGYDGDAAASARALQRGALDAVATLEEIARESDAVVFATHVRGTLLELGRLRGAAPRAELLIDVGSVKAPVVEAARGLANFVASHPMAGSAQSGPDAADPGLFAGKPWLYVATGDAALDARAQRFIADLGGVPIATGADEHDALVAITSHVPQVLATLFCLRLAREGGAAASFRGPVARELQRLGASNPAMWRDVLQANRKNVARELRALARELDRAADALDASDMGYLDEAFARANAAVRA